MKDGSKKGSFVLALGAVLVLAVKAWADPSANFPVPGTGLRIFPTPGATPNKGFYPLLPRPTTGPRKSRAYPLKQPQGAGPVPTFRPVRPGRNPEAHPNSLQGLFQKAVPTPAYRPAMPGNTPVGPSDPVQNLFKDPVVPPR